MKRTLIGFLLAWLVFGCSTDRPQEEFFAPGDIGTLVVDGVLIVIEPGGTRIGPAQVLMEQLQRAGARVVGVVLNPISRRSSHYYTKYGYYSSYYYYSRKYGNYYSEDGKKVRSKNGKSDQEGTQSPPVA